MTNSDGWPDAAELCQIAMSCLEAISAIQAVPIDTGDNSRRLATVGRLVTEFPSTFHELIHIRKSKVAGTHFADHAMAGRRAVSISWIDTHSATEAVLRLTLCILNRFNIVGPWDWNEKKQATLSNFWPYVVPGILSPANGDGDQSASLPEKGDDAGCRVPLILDFPLSPRHLEALTEAVRHEMREMTRRAKNPSSRRATGNRGSGSTKTSQSKRNGNRFHAESSDPKRKLKANLYKIIQQQKIEGEGNKALADRLRKNPDYIELAASAGIPAITTALVKAALEAKRRSTK